MKHLQSFESFNDSLDPNLKSVINSIKWSRKPVNAGDISDSYYINYSTIEPHKDKLNVYPMENSFFQLPTEIQPGERVFIAKIDDQYFLVDTSGYDYCRYVVHIKNYPVQ